MKLSKVLVVEADKCFGCKVCELVCSMVKTGEYNPRNSRIRVLQNRELDINLPVIRADCDQGGKCVEWCFPQAIRFVDFEDAAIMRKEAKLGTFPVLFTGS